MAEIRDELVLEIDQALRQIDDLERALDRSLGAVEVRVDATQAQRQLQELADDADRALSDVDVEIDSSGAARLNDELAGVERNLTEADAEADQLAGSLREADRAADNINTSSKNLNTSFGGLKTAALGIASAFAAIGAGQLFGQGIRGANAAVQQFAILEDSVNAVNVIFGTAAESVLEFGETAAESAGLSSSAFNQAVTPIGNLLQNFGFNAQEAADASVILVQRAADLASVLGGDVQTALAAVSSALRGQSEPLTAYGANISAAAVEQFALANGLAATKGEITDAITLQARYGLILERTAAVAGDYAATSEDLANAQRTLGGLASDLAAELGEALAPAFEAILAQGPEVVNLLASMAPALADAAGNAEAASSGFVVGVTNVVLGIGGISNALGSFANLVQAGAEGIKGIGLSLNPFREAGEEFADFNIQLDEFNNNIAQDFINNAGLQIPRAIQAGIAPVNAFGIAIASLAQKDDSLETIQLGFERLAIQSGLTDDELQAVTRALLDQADVLELSAEEITFLASQLNVLNETLDDGGRANADYLASVAAFPGVFDTTTTSFTTFTNAAGEIPERMNTVAIEMRLAAGAMGEALNPFEEAAEAIPLSAQEFFERLIAEIDAQATFQAGIAELIMRGQFDLAEMLGKQGPAVQETLTGFLEDVDLAAAANSALAGEGTKFSRAVGDELTAALASGDLTPEMEQAFIDFLDDGIFNNSQVEDAIVTGTASAAATTSSSYLEALGDEIDGFDATVLQDKLANLFSGVTFNIDASQFNFPDSGEFQGTIGAGAVLGTLATPQTGITTSTPVANSTGGFTYAPTVNNPIVEDLETTLAKNNQIMGSVAGILNGNFNL